MLGTTLWLTLAIGLFATVLVDAASAFGRASAHAAADHAVETAMHDAVADYQNRVQAALALSAATAPGTDRYAAAVATLPNPLERVYPADGDSAGTAGSGTRFTVAYDVVPTTLVAPSCAAAGETDADAPDTIGWLQCNGFVTESRISLRVVVRVLDPSGNAVLAQREQDVTLRLFGEPPYSAVAGRKDATAADPASADALTVPAHEGDVAGDTLSGATAQPLASPWPAGGTLIHVRYECHDGAGSCANAAPPDPDADLRAGARWSNGNRPAP
jgi:hypothetical protein